MRSDFSKVVTERPRHGSWKSHRLVRRAIKPNFDEDTAGHKEGMRRPYGRGYDYKEFSDLLGPLYRFLQSRVGRRWDNVHSEICANLKGRNTQQQHILDHLYRYVDTNIAIDEDGKPYSKPTRFRCYSPGLIYGDFYVDPRDGILRETKKYSWKHRNRNKPEKPLMEFTDASGKTFKAIEGIWYEITITERSYSYIHERTLERVHCIIKTEKKRQLNAKELRSMKLENTADEGI